MQVKVPIKQAPFTGDKYIYLWENGRKKEFFCKTVFPAKFDNHFYYILPDGFPVFMVKLIFGPEAQIVGGGYGTYKTKRKQGKSNALPPALVESTR